MLRLVLELRIFAALGNTDALLEREADVLDALERDVTAVPRNALSAILTCVSRHRSLSTAIAMCQRLEAPLTKDKRPRKLYAALVHTVLKPTVYDDTKTTTTTTTTTATTTSTTSTTTTAAPAAAVVADGDMESDDASEAPDDLDTDPAAAQRAAERKKKRQLDKFVRDLLTESEADTQLKFIKRFAKRIETDDPDALAFALANKPRVVLSAKVNDQFVELALRARRFDVLYVHALDLMAVVDGYPYNSQLAHFLYDSFDELDRFIERALGASNDDRCALLCDMLSQMACVIESARAMPKPLFDKCSGGLTRGTEALTQAYPDVAHVKAALERIQAGKRSSKSSVPALVSAAVKALESFL